ncbi:hypothetical protein SAMN02745975_02557 [Geosporobacter subterraneus DSM 17957]|uniref:Uncharacterized protein n=1 Tax=Geosporobacter subterraneus DSM 17957 TaxID=1121919 RepID=A0A1M6L1E2_9FIRM|nr:hypothetical protein [Geosporobacter subterraneus]SHJ64932.1 hypothetical protein SAMN02745975_02557 [Geosporobacter subterraneus DSM 17957]
MKQVARKLFIDFEKEEQWINKMATRGMNFIDSKYPLFNLIELDK